MPLPSTCLAVLETWREWWRYTKWSLTPRLTPFGWQWSGTTCLMLKLSWGIFFALFLFVTIHYGFDRDAKEDGIEPGPTLYLQYIKYALQNDQEDKAMDILREMEEEGVVLDPPHMALLARTPAFLVWSTQYLRIDPDRSRGKTYWLTERNARVSFREAASTCSVEWSSLVEEY